MTLRIQSVHAVQRLQGPDKRVIAEVSNLYISRFTGIS